MAEIILIESPRARKRKPEEIRRMTPELLGDLLRIHASCVYDQEGRCPLLVSVRSLYWEINKAMGVTNEEDKAFRRADPMCAARPLTVPFVEED